jgi:hypothetical protein
MQDADDMLLVDQNMAYDQCGVKIKEDLMQGSAVVLFAYGLSGSGKTYTVFGPDAIDAPEAWYVAIPVLRSSLTRYLMTGLAFTGLSTPHLIRCGAFSLIWLTIFSK